MAASRGVSPVDDCDEAIVSLEVTYGYALPPAGFHRVVRRATAAGGAGASSGRLSPAVGADDGRDTHNAKLSVDVEGPQGEVHLWYKRGSGAPIVEVQVLRAAAGEPTPTPPDGFERVGKSIIRTKADGTSYLVLRRSREAGAGGTVDAILSVAVLYGEEAGVPPAPESQGADGFTVLSPSLDASNTVWLAVRRGGAVVRADAPAFNLASVKVGDAVDVQDPVNLWCPATVTSVSERDDKLTVAIPSWGEGFVMELDRIVDADSVAAPGSRTSARAWSTPRRIRGAIWDIEAPFLEAMSAFCDGVAANEVTPELCADFIDRRLQSVVEKLMTARLFYSTRGKEAGLNKMVQACVKVVASVFSQTSTVEIPTTVWLTLRRLFDGDADYGYFYRTYGTPTLGARTVAPAPDVAAGSIAVVPPAVYDRYSYRTVAPRTSKYLLASINTFCQAGGFAAWTDRLSRGISFGSLSFHDAAELDWVEFFAAVEPNPDVPHGCSLTDLAEVIPVFEAIKSMVHLDFKRSYFARDFLRLMFARLVAMSDAELSSFDVNAFALLAEQLRALISSIFRSSSATLAPDVDAASEEAELALALRLLRAGRAPSVQVKGVKILNELIDATDRLSYQGRRAKHFTERTLCRRLKDARAVEVLLGKSPPDADGGESKEATVDANIVELVVPILTILEDNSLLQEAHLEALWELFSHEDPSVVKAAGRALGAMVDVLEDDQAQLFMLRLADVPMEKYTVETISLIREVTKVSLKAYRLSHGDDDDVGVQMLWNACMDDAPVDEDVTSAARAALVSVLKVATARTQRVAYLNKCVINLVWGKSVARSLSLARAILAEVRGQSYSNNRRAVIRALDAYCRENCTRGLSAVIVDDLVRYKVAALAGLAVAAGEAAAGAGPASGDEDDVTVKLVDPALLDPYTSDSVRHLAHLAVERGSVSDAGTLVLTGKTSHIEAVRTRLDFLSYILDESELTLRYEEIQLAWRTSVTLSLADGERDLFLDFLRSALPKEASAYATSSKVEASAITKVFSSLLCEPSSTSRAAGSDSFAMFEAFRAYFRYCNIKERNVHERHEPGMRGKTFLESAVAPEEMQGFDRLWSLVLHAKDARTIASAAEFLISLYMHLGVAIERTSGDLWSAFVRRCIASLSDAVAGGTASSDSKEAESGNPSQATMVAVVELLGTFFRALSNRKSTKQASAVSPPRRSPLAGGTYMTCMVARGRGLPISKSVIVPRKVGLTVGELRAAVGKCYGVPGNCVRVLTLDREPVEAGFFDTISCREANVSNYSPDIVLLTAPAADTKQFEPPDSSPGDRSATAAGAGAGDSDSDEAHDDDDPVWSISGAGWAGFRRIKWAASDRRWEPVRLISHSPEHFSLFFGLLDSDVPVAVSERVWSLLQSLPPSNQQRETMRSALEGSESDSWDTLLHSSSPLAQLYSLCVLEYDIREWRKSGADGVADATQALGLFANTGGADLLQSSLLSMDVLQVRGNPLHRARTAMLLKLLSVLVVDVHASVGDSAALSRRAVQLLVEAVQHSGPGTVATYCTFAVRPQNEKAEARAWRSVEAEMVRWSVRLLGSLCVQSPPLIRVLVAGDAAAELHSPLETILFGGLLRAEDPAVREALRVGYQELCEDVGDSEAVFRAAVELMPVEAAVHMMLSGVKHVYAHRERCSDFFKLLRWLVQSALKSNSIDAAELCLQLVRIIRQHPVREKTADDHDDVLRGLLSVTSALFGKEMAPVADLSLAKSQASAQSGAASAGDLPDRPPDLSRQGSMDSIQSAGGRALRREAASLVPQLFWVGLFGDPADVFEVASPADSDGEMGLTHAREELARPAVSAASVAAPPMAKNARTRQEAFKLLLALSKGSATACSLVLRLLAGQHFAGDHGASLLSPSNDDERESRSSKGRHAPEWELTVEAEEPKSETGYVGLLNLGCICYMNALLQQFFTLKSFRDGTLAFQFDEDHAPDKDDGSALMWQLQRMYTHLALSQRQYYDPTGFCLAYKGFDGAPVDVTVQQDASEFLTNFFQTLESTMAGTPSEGLLRNVFGGQQVQRLDSVDGSEHSESEQFYQFISVAVAGMGNLQASLRDFVAPESVEYRWEKGGELPTQKRVCLKTLPKHLIIHLKRFTMNMETLATVKVNDRFEFPFEIDMRPFTAAAIDEEIEEAKRAGAAGEVPTGRTSPPPGAAAAVGGGAAGGAGAAPGAVPAVVSADAEMYRLSGVVIHVGGANSGHYYSLIRDREGDPTRWLEFNDKVVSPFNIETLDDEAFGGEDTFASESIYRTTTTKVEKSRNAFMLIYDRVEDDAPEASPRLARHGSRDGTTALRATGPASAAGKVYPPGPYSEVVELNRTYWRRHYLLSEQYAQFAKSVMELHEQNGTGSRSRPARSTARLHSSDTDRAADMSETPADPRTVLVVPKVSTRTVMASLPLLKAQFGTRYLFGTLARSKGRKGFASFSSLLEDVLRSDGPASVWFLRFMSRGAGGTLLREYLVDSKSKRVSAALLNLITTSFRGVHVHADASSPAILEGVRGLVAVFPWALLAKHVRKPFLTALLAIVGMGGNEAAAAGQCGLVGGLANFCAVSTGTAEQARDTATAVHNHIAEITRCYGASEGGEAKEAVETGDGAERKGEEAPEVPPRPARDPDFDEEEWLLGAQALSTLLANIGAHTAPATDGAGGAGGASSASDAVAPEGSAAEFVMHSEDRDALAHPEFIDFLLYSLRLPARGAHRSESRRAAASHILGHVCYENKGTTDVVVERFTTLMLENDGEDLVFMFRAAKVLLDLEDSLSTNRLDEIMTKMLSAIETGSKPLDKNAHATLISFHRLRKLCMRQAMVQFWMRSNTVKWAFIRPILREAPARTRYRRYRGAYDAQTASVLSSKVESTEKLDTFFNKLEDPDGELDWDLDTQYNSDSEPTDLIGARISVRWVNRGKQSWYPGQVTEYDPRARTHMVVYDDGDRKRYDLISEGKKVWRTLQPGASVRPIRCRVCGCDTRL